MNRAAIAEARALQSWRDYQFALTRAIAPLTDEQLRQRPLPGRRTAGELAEHIVFGRALHLHGVLGEAAAELQPWLQWDAVTSLPRSAASIVHGLESTWRVLVDALTRGAPTDDLMVGEVAAIQTIWGLLDHDLPHAGQLSLLLRASGLLGVEI